MTIEGKNNKNITNRNAQIHKNEIFNRFLQFIRNHIFTTNTFNSPNCK